MSINEKTLLSPLNVLKEYGIKTTNVRFIKKGYTTYNLIISTESIEELKNFIASKNIEDYNIYYTFNTINPSKEGEASISDEDVVKTNFVLIDIDTVKKGNNCNATEEEKEQSKMILDKVSNFLNIKGIKRQWIMDSGNGYHILIPITPTTPIEITETIKNLLKFLAEKFNSIGAKIDTFVYNPSRITRFYGTRNIKGVHTEDRPIRQSNIISCPVDKEVNDVLILQNILNEKDVSECIIEKDVTTQSSTKKEKIYAKGLEWLEYYGFNIEFCKKYDNEVSVYKFVDGCPIREHSTLDKGAYFTIDKNDGCTLGCHHASCQEVSIRDFNEKYPCPDDLLIKSDVISFENMDKIPTKEELLEGKEYVFNNGEYILNISGLFMKSRVKNSDGKPIRISNPMFINEVKFNSDSKYYTYNIVSYVHKNFSDILIGADVFNSLSIKVLSKYGITVHPHGSEMLSFLIYQKDLLPLNYNHDKIGWVYNNDRLSFNLQDSYGSENISTLNEESDIPLDYKGDYLVWKRMIEENVLGSNLEIVLAIGFSSIILGYLSKTTHPNIGSLIFNIQGDSSTGKTTGLNLVSSIFGNPFAQLNTFNSTDNALIESLGNNFGVTVVIDELGASKNKNLTEFIYQVSTGIGRKRLSSESVVQGVKKFNTIILSSSEDNFVEQLENKKGLFVRLIELSSDYWSKSSNDSKKIKEICSCNYGVAGKELLNRLFSNEKGLNIIHEKYLEAGKLLADFPDSSLKDRLVDVYSIVVASSLLLKELLSIELNVEKIVHFIINREKIVMKERLGYPINIVDKIKEYILLNKNKFIPSNLTDYIVSSSLGRIKFFNGKECYEIYKEHFEKIMQEKYGVTSIKNLLSFLHNQGILIKTEKKRNYVRVDFNGLKGVKCYRLNINNMKDTDIKEEK